MTILATLLLSAALSGGISDNAGRTSRTINSRWNFIKEGKTEVVDLPHTWNSKDTFDDEKGYYRGPCEYSKTIHINEDLEGRRAYLRFEGANLVTDLTVNGQNAGHHIGGYTAFCFEITGFIHKGVNEISVKVDNSPNSDIAPISADFTFFGGIYRDLELILVPENHISLSHYGSNGVYISTPSVSESCSAVEIRTHLSLAEGKGQTLVQEIISPDGAIVSSVSDKVKGSGETVISQNCTVKPCRLWDIDSPQNYTVVTRLCDKSGKTLDCVSNPLGFRTFSFDTEKGFFLNGRNLKLMGTSRHEDYFEKGNALPDAIHIRDVRSLKEAGGNFLRISHYPQDPAVLRECERQGILSTIEIPIVNYATPGDEFTKNQMEQLREMIFQNYNSPSVIIWGYMNEVLLSILHRMKATDAQKEEYFKSVTTLARALDDETHKLDSRPTFIAFSDNIPGYIASGLTDIPDIQGWNFYRGWYGKKIKDFKTALEEVHTKIPKPLFISEYGVGMDNRIHSRKPEKFDFSLEYGLDFHRQYAKDILSNDYVFGGCVWNLCDFYSDGRIDATPNVNNKGLMTLKREKKNPYLFYKALLGKTPMLAIGDRGWSIRSCNEGDSLNVPVFCNSDSVSLSLNGQDLGTRATDMCTAFFPIRCRNGMNKLVARSGELTDIVSFNCKLVPADLRDFRELNVMLGSERYFESEQEGICWIPEQEYRKGGWGYVGGHQGRPKASGRTVPASTYSILGTDEDPIFQTQRVGIESFKADVPDGQYFVYLYFAELASGGKSVASAYNLGFDQETGRADNRVFDISINGVNVLKGLNIREQYGELQAVIQKFTVTVSGGKGLNIDFHPQEGAAVLNAVRIYKSL